MTVETLESRQMFASVTGLVLVNADTGQTIAPLTNGATINLATLPTRRISVRADATSDTESVRFKLDATKSHTENIAPYALLGNDGNTYTPWKATLGSHTLTTTAYTRDNARGTAAAKTITFKLIDQPVTTPGEPAPEPAPQPEPQPQPQPDPGVTPPNLSGTWKLDWADEFDDGNLDGWNTNIWWDKTGGMGDETTSPSNVSVSGGTLNLTATKSGSSYTSGLVTTDNFKEFQYGYVEARIDIPQGVGFFPAFWMLPGNHDDGLGEIDIMEWVGDDRDWMHANYHIDGPGDAGRSASVGFNMDEGYHTYGVNWQKDTITWYVDGKEFYKAANKTNTPMYVILNLAVGGDWAGPPNSATQFPSSMKVDYVRVWKPAA